MKIFSYEKYLHHTITNTHIQCNKFPLTVVPLNETTYIQHSPGIFCE